MREIAGPYVFVPKEDVEGGVNGKRFFYRKDHVQTIGYPEFEVLVIAKIIKL